MFPSEFQSSFIWVAVLVVVLLATSLIVFGYTIKMFQVESNIKTHCYIESLIAKETFDAKACVDKFKNRLLWGDFK